MDSRNFRGSEFVDVIRTKKDPLLMPKISHRIIYKYIKEHPEDKLEKYLRRRGKRYHYQSATTFNQTNREKHSIHDRPQEIDDNIEPGHSEGGTIVGLDKNENFNGLVRVFFPRKTDFKTLTKSDILEVESLLNNRPRKRFGGLTPLEVQELLMLCT